MTEGETEKPRAYNRLKTLRRDAGLTRDDLAEAVHISPATLGNIERGAHEPGVLLAWRIAGYFELPLEAVFSDEPIPSLSRTLKALYPCSYHAADTELQCHAPHEEQS